VLSSQAAVEDNDYTTSNKPSSSFMHPIECASSESTVVTRYIRTAKVSATVDERLDDLGIFQVSTVGLSAAAGTVLGNIYVSYDIELLKPQLPDQHLGTSFFLQSVGSVAPLSWASNLNCKVSTTNTLPIVVTGNSTTSLTLNMPTGFVGQYQLLLTASVVSGGTWNFSAVAGSDVSLTPVFVTPANAMSDTANTNSDFWAVLTFSTIATNASNNVIRITLSNSSSTAIGSVNMSVLPIANALTYGDGIPYTTVSPLTYQSAWCPAIEAAARRVPLRIGYEDEEKESGPSINESEYGLMSGAATPRPHNQVGPAGSLYIPGSVLRALTRG